MTYIFIVLVEEDVLLNKNTTTHTHTTIKVRSKHTNITLKDEQIHTTQNESKVRFTNPVNRGFIYKKKYNDDETS